MISLTSPFFFRALLSIFCLLALTPSAGARMPGSAATGASSVNTPVLGTPLPVLGNDPHHCLAQAIYHEARGESPKGRKAVASVVVNRAESNRWGNTVCSVLRNGFSFVRGDDAVPAVHEKEAWEDAWTMAHEILSKGPPFESIDHFHSARVTPSWTGPMQKKYRIGSHIFYRDPATRFGVHDIGG